jgi:hypothetical protein
MLQIEKSTKFKSGKYGSQIRPKPEFLQQPLNDLATVGLR